MANVGFKPATHNNRKHGRYFNHPPPPSPLKRFRNRVVSLEPKPPAIIHIRPETTINYTMIYNLATMAIVLWSISLGY